MSVQQHPASTSHGVPSLQDLCAIQVNKMLNAELANKAKNEGVAINGPSSIGLTTTRVLEAIRSVKREDPSLTKQLPWVFMEVLSNPYLLVAYQKTTLAAVQNGVDSSKQPQVLPEAERTWKALCEKHNYTFKPGDPEMTWEELYFKEKVAKAFLYSYGNFESIDPEDWYLFNSNRSRIKVLEFVGNPWIKGEKLKEICALFSEVRSLRVDGCYMKEKDWVAAFSKLKKVEHLDLGIHMDIENEALEALSKNAVHLKSLKIPNISYCVNLEAIVRLLKKEPELKSLTIGERQNLKGICQIRQVLKAAPQLEELELNGFKSLILKDIDDLLKEFPNIQKLTLRDCPNLKREDLGLLTTHPQLKALEIFKCKNLENNDLGITFLDKCPELERFICARE